MQMSYLYEYLLQTRQKVCEYINKRNFVSLSEAILTRVSGGAVRGACVARRAPIYTAMLMVAGSCPVLVIV